MKREPGTRHGHPAAGIHRLARSARLLLSALLAMGCAPGALVEDEIGTLQQAVTCSCPSVPSSTFTCAGCPITISLPLPKGLASEDVALGASQTLRVNDRVVVARTDGTLAAVSNIGSGETNLGAEAQVGQIWSTSPVTLRSNSLVTGTLASTAGSTLQAGAKINGFSAPQVASLPLRATTLTTTFPAGGSDVALEPDQQRSLLPGAFGAVSLKSRAKLSLSAGTYYFRSLGVESGARLSANVSAGPVTVYVAQGFSFKGVTEELPASSSETKLRIIVLGTTEVFVEAPFAGALLVPNAKLTLASVLAGHRGTFFARALEAHQGTRIVHWPFLVAPPKASGALVAELRALDSRIGAATTEAFRADVRAVSAEADYVLHPSPAAEATSDALHEARLTTRNAAVAVASERDAFMNLVVAQANPQAAGYIESVLVVFLADFRRSLGLWAPADAFDASCKELVQNQLLFDLVSAILKDDLPGYALALSEVEKALQCASLEDSRLYAEALARALERSVARFPVASRAVAETVLVAALANLVLLVHDDTKLEGPTRLYDWMGAHVTSLRDSFLDNASMFRKAGLWLRYPSGATLVQVKNLCESSPVTGCISGELLIYALTDAWRLGSGVCTALEMASAPFDTSFGYSCDRGVCGSTPSANGTFPPAGSGPVIDRAQAAGGLTPFGVSMTALQGKLCNQQRRNDQSTPAGWDRLLKCGIAPEQAARTELLSCIWDASHPDPNLALGRILTGNGWPAGTCGPSVTDAAPESTRTAAKEILDEKRDEIKESAEKRGYKAVTDKQIDDAKANVDKHNVLSHDAFVQKAKANHVPLDPDTAAFTVTNGAGISKTYVDAARFAERTPQQKAELLAHEAIHQILRAAQDKKGVGTDEEREHGVICTDLGFKNCGANMCAPDSNCGCSPASAYAETFRECVAPNLPTGLPPVEPITRLIYPTDDATGSRWRECFGAGFEHLSVPAICTKIVCAADYAVAFQDGKCLCSIDRPAGMQTMNNCTRSIRCDTGVPIVLPSGGCGCSGGNGVLGTGGTTNPPPAPICRPPVNPQGPVGPGGVTFFTDGMGTLVDGTARTLVCGM